MDIVCELNLKTDNNVIGNTKGKQIVVNQCCAIKVNGERCLNYSIINTDKCVAHSRKNGNKSVNNLGNTAQNGIDKGNARIKVFIAQIIRQIKQGKIESSAANAIFNGCQKLIEINNIEREDALFKELMDKVNKAKQIAPGRDYDIIDMVE